MKLLLLISVMLIINGCSLTDLKPCEPQPCVKIFPKLPTYKLPKIKKLTEPVHIGGGMYAIVGTELEECLRVNIILRRKCTDYAVINKRVNKEYQNK